VNDVVVDASAGVQISLDTRRGRALAALIPSGAAAWVPEHFLVEVLAGLRRQLLIERAITADQADAARRRLERWNLRVASVRPFGNEAWGFRHNMSMGDAFYIALASHLGADFLTDDHKLVGAPTFPASINVLSLPKSAPS
jgi:predicted nucleic acid-binding protein